MAKLKDLKLKRTSETKSGEDLSTQMSKEEYIAAMSEKKKLNQKEESSQSQQPSTNQGSEDGQKELGGESEATSDGQEQSEDDLMSRGSSIPQKYLDKYEEEKRKEKEESPIQPTTEDQIAEKGKVESVSTSSVPSRFINGKDAVVEQMEQAGSVPQRFKDKSEVLKLKSRLELEEALKSNKKKEIEESKSSFLNRANSFAANFDQAVLGAPGELLKSAGILSTGIAKTIGMEDVETEDDVLYKLGSAWTDKIKETFPNDPNLQDELSDQMGRVVGDLFTIYASGGIGALRKAPVLAGKEISKTGVKQMLKQTGQTVKDPSLYVGATQMSVPEFEEAINQGATDEEAFEVWLKNAVTGSILERLPAQMFFNRLNKVSNGGLVNVLKRGTVGGTEEAVTEVLQSMYANKTAQEVYNSTRDVLDGVGEGGGIGFGLGFVINALGGKLRNVKGEYKGTEAQKIQDAIDLVENEKIKLEAANENIINNMEEDGVDGEVEQGEPDYKIGDLESSKEEINNKIESAKTTQDLEGININNDAELEGKVSEKYNELQDVTVGEEVQKDEEVKEGEDKDESEVSLEKQNIPLKETVYEAPTVEEQSKQEEDVPQEIETKDGSTEAGTVISEEVGSEIPETETTETIPQEEIVEEEQVNVPEGYEQLGPLAVKTKDLPEKQVKINKLADSLRDFKGLNRNDQKSKEGVEKWGKIYQMAQDVGVKVDSDPTSDSFQVGQIPKKKGGFTMNSEVENFVPLEERENAEKIKPILDYLMSGERTEMGTNFNTPYYGTLKNKEVRQGLRAIQNNKNSLAAQTLLDSIDSMIQSGIVEVTQGSGKNMEKVGVPFEEYYNAVLEEATQEEIEQNREEIDNIANTFTNEEWDNILKNKALTPEEASRLDQAIADSYYFENYSPEDIVEMAEEGDVEIDPTETQQIEKENVDIESKQEEDARQQQQTEPIEQARGTELPSESQEDATITEEVQQEQQAELPEEIEFERFGESKKGKVIEDLGDSWTVRDGKAIYMVDKATGISPPHFAKKPKKKNIEDNLDELDSRFDETTNEEIDKATKKSTGEILSRIIPITQISAGSLKLQDIWAKQADKIEDYIATKVKQGLQSRVPIIKEATGTLRNLMGGLPYTQQEIREKLELKGGLNYGGKKAQMFMDQAKKIVGEDYHKLKRVHSTLDPELYPGEAVDISRLSEEEKALHDLLRDANDFIHEENYRMGLIDDETYNKYKGRYIARLYEEFEGVDVPEGVQDMINDVNSAYKTDAGPKLEKTTGLITGIFKRRKDPKKVKATSINDPIYLTGKRIAQLYQNQAILDYSTMVAENQTLDKFTDQEYKEIGSPKGYTKLKGSKNQYGPLTNMYVPNHIAEDFNGFFFANSALNKMYDVFKWYDRTQARQFLKKYHTVLSPGVQLGNFFSNYTFAFLSGIDPISHTKNLVEAKNQVKNKGPEYIELIKAGIIGSDVLTKDLRPMVKEEKTQAITDKTAKGLNALSDNLIVKLGKYIDKKAIAVYEGSDNYAKLSAYITLKNDYGYTKEEAINKVYEGFQNYAAVGKMYDVASKTPLMGNPYVKFAADLSRILKNAATKRPLQSAMFLAIVKATSSLLSEWSGESEEKKKLRESRAWIPKVPLPEVLGGDVPLVFQTPIGEVNAARYMSPYYIYDKGYSGSNLEYISKFLPYQVTTFENSAGENFSPDMSDVFLGPYLQLVYDQDFRGKSIKDPKATPFKPSHLTEDEKFMNQLLFLARNHGPFYQAYDDMKRAFFTGVDYYGRTRDVQDAILSKFIKIQQIGDKELEELATTEINYLVYQAQESEKKIKSSGRELEKKIVEISERNITDKKKEDLIEEEINLHKKRMNTFLEEQEEIINIINDKIDQYTKAFPE